MAMNLVQHRGAPSVWDRVDGKAEWDTERWLAALLAGGFLISGVRRRSTSGLLLMIGGAGLAWWAAAGLDERNQRRGQLKAVMPHRSSGDVIVEASEESFPASDAPSWTPTTGNTCPGSETTARWH